MRDLFLDPLTGDIFVSPTSEARLTQTFEEDAIQRLRMRLRRFAGEWFLDTQLGIPYRRDILVKNPDLQVVKSVLVKELLSDSAVDAVSEFALEQDPGTRHLSVRFTVVLTSAVSIETALLLTPLITDGFQLIVDDDMSDIVP